MRRRRRGAQCSTVSTRRRLSSVHRAAWRWVRVVSESFQVPAAITDALAELARSRQTTVSTVLQAGWAQVLMMLTGRSDVAFGTAVSGRPADVAGADLMVGLLINTVPVRARVTASDTVADLLEQVQREHNDTPSSTNTGADRNSPTRSATSNCSTPCSSTRTTRWTPAALLGNSGLTVSAFTSREYNHYPLSVTAIPGEALGLRVEFDTEVFDTHDVTTLMESFRHVLEAMTAEPTQQLSAIRRTRRRGPGTPRRGPTRGADRAGARLRLDPGRLRRTGGPFTACRRGQVRGPLAELPRGRHRCQPIGGDVGTARRGTGSAGGVVVTAMRRCGHWPCSLCSRPGRPTCPSTPAHSAARMEFVLADATPVAVITTAVLRTRLDSEDLLVIDVDDPAWSSRLVHRCRRLRPMRSRT